MKTMRRGFAAVIALVLCICLAVVALADYDLSGLSVNELNELIAAAQKEILDKGGDVKIPGGKYVVGMDIAPGSYDMRFADDALMTAIYIMVALVCIVSWRTMLTGLNGTVTVRDVLYMAIMAAVTLYAILSAVATVVKTE